VYRFARTITTFSRSDCSHYLRIPLKQGSVAVGTEGYKMHCSRTDLHQQLPCRLDVSRQPIYLQSTAEDSLSFRTKLVSHGSARWGKNHISPFVLFYLHGTLCVWVMSCITRQDIIMAIRPVPHGNTIENIWSTTSSAPFDE
jgi:hypothetical protein